ncbi:hypothetical protein D3C76_1778930 [compost metagenome]
MIAKGGIIVIARRKYRLILLLMKPCITTSPAIVPTEELDSPAMSSPKPKEMAVTGPAK